MKATYTIHNFAKRLVMAVLVILTANNVWGATTYKLTAVTSVSAGNKYVFVQSSQAMIGTQTSNYVETTDSYSTTGLSGTESYVWTLEAGTEPATSNSGFYIKNCSTTVYVRNSEESGTKLTLPTNTGSPAGTTTRMVWSFAFSGSTATISCVANSRVLAYAGASDYRYRAYTSDTSNPKSITVYRLDEEASGYAVTYNNGGHGVAPSNTTATSVTLAAITGVTGYTCTGWKANVAVTVGGVSKSAGTLLANGSTATLSAATTFTAQWSANEYTITLDDGDGSGGDGTIAVTYDANTNLTSGVTVPTLEHFDFGGYYTAVSGGGSQIIDANGDVVASVSNYTSATKQWIKASDVTLYAKWTEHSLINYRTVCCTELGDIDGDVNITTDGCDPGEIKVTWKMEATTGIASQTLRVYDENVDEVTAKRITSITPSTSNQTKTISGLDPCKDYLVTIENVSSGGSYCAAGAPWTSDVVTTLGYSITYNTPNITLSSGTEVKNSCSADDVDVVYTANDGYHLPTSITVTNAGDEDDNWTWDAANGEFIILDLSAVTGDVVVNIAGQLDACDDYSFFYGTTQGSENNFECFSFVTGSTDTWLTDIWTIPSSDQWTYVGEPDWDPSSGKSANLQLSSMPYALNHANNLGSISTGVMEGAEGYVKICTNSSDANRYVGFIPAGYVFRWGTDGSGWSSIAFTGKTSAIEEEDWYTPLQTWTSSNADDYTYVGLKTSSGYVWANRSETRRPVFLKPTSAWDHSNAYFAIYYFDASSHTGWSAIMTDPDGDGIYEAWIPDTYTYTTVNFVRLSTATADWNNKWNQTGNITLPSDKNVFTITGGSGDAYTGEWSLYDKKGTFHISANSNTNNWYCHFLPHHVLHYDANSGSGAPADQTIAVNASPCQLTVSTTEPTRIGYTFAGWNESSSAAAKDDDWDGGDTHTMSADVTLYAVWTANTNTPYTVKHYKQKLDGTYDSTPDDTDNLTGTTATNVTPDRKSYTGFTAPDAQTETIAADGSLVIEYKYTRNSYTLAWSLDGGSISVAGTTAGSVKYEASLTAPTVTKTGYTFSAWSPSVPSTMPAANSTYTATWTANTNTAYTVEHYKQKLDGTYPASADETDNLTGTTATSVTPDRKSYTGFTAPSGQTETIAADGSLVIVYKYTRNKYNVAVASVGNVTITATPSGGSAIAESADADVYYGQSVTLANSGITSGYFWAGWKVTKQSDGTDVTASVVSTNTLTVPAYAINVSAGLYSNAIAWCDPDVEVTGDVHLTSTKDVYVHLPSTGLININSDDMGSATKMEVGYLDENEDEVDKAESPFRLYNSTASSTIDEEDLEYGWDVNYSLRYTPTDYSQLHNYKLQLTFKRGDKVLKTVTHDINGRSLPEKFVIAVKNTNDSKWYALPSNLASTKDAQGVIALNPALEIEVDNTTTPTKATIAPTTRIYKALGRATATNNMYGIRFTTTGSNKMQAASDATYVWLPTANADNSQVWQLASSNLQSYTVTMPTIGSKKLGIFANSGDKFGYAATPHSYGVYFLPVETEIAELAATADDWTQHDVLVEANASSVSATKVLGILGATTSDKETLADPVATNTYLLKLDGDLDYTNKNGQTLQFKWYDSSDKLKAYSWVTVPSIITTGTKTTWSALEDSLTTSTTLNDIVVLSKPMTVGDAHAKAKKIVMDKSGGNTGKLTIQPNKGLEVAGTVKVYDGSAFGATTEADLVLESDEDGNASLIFDNSNACKATVQMYSIGDIVDANTWNWQFMGTPFTSANALYSYYGSYLYEWKEGGYWDAVANGGTMTPFTGYCITQDEPTYYVMDGTLNPTTSKTLTVPAGVEMVFANSWSAPIDIGTFTDDAFGIATKTVYLFNTGFAPNKGDAEEGTAAGTYVVVPIHSSPYTGNELIAPMQGFYVDNTSGSAGSITMDYSTVVRPTRDRNIVAGPMHAPKRAENEPSVMKIKATGSRYSERIVILEREDFSTGFDNGWDGKNLNEPGVAPILYALRADGTKDAVSAIPAYEGTVVGFRKGEDNAYTFSFEYDGDETLYLNDLQTQTSTLIDAEHTYAFSTESNDAEARFIISATPIQQMPTSIDNGGLMNDGMVKVRKVIINDQLYIIRGGRMYSAEGQMVK